MDGAEAHGVLIHLAVDLQVSASTQTQELWALARNPRHAHRQWRRHRLDPSVDHKAFAIHVLKPGLVGDLSLAVHPSGAQGYQNHHDLYPCSETWPHAM